MFSRYSKWIPTGKSRGSFVFRPWGGILSKVPRLKAVTCVEGAGSGEKASGAFSLFRALRNRNYRLFIGGQIISLTGTWIQQVAVSWLVYRLTNSVLLLGVVGFVSQIPALFIAPLAGVIADRHSRRAMLIITQSLSMAQALILAALVVTHRVTVAHIIVLSAFLGLVNAFDIPIRQAFTGDMIARKEDLGNAIALNSSTFNAARLLGPSVAGILIAAAGEGICFIVNGVSYLAVIASLCAMRIKLRRKTAPARTVVHELKEGFACAFGCVPIRTILGLLAVVSLTGAPYQVLMPVFARDIFHGGARELGFLVAMSGAGALAGALYLATRRSVAGLGRIIGCAAMLFGAGIILFSLSRDFRCSLVIIAGAGFGIMIQTAASNTVLQTIVDEDKRGRIMSFYTLAFMGVIPFGNLLSGVLANKVGAPNALIFGGVCCVVAGSVFYRQLPAFKAQVRPIYVKNGVITEGV